MRLFFFISLFSQAVLSLYGNPSYESIPFYERGVAYLTEDILPGKRRTPLHFYILRGDKGVSAGADFTQDVWIPNPDETHCRGEIVEARITAGEEGVSRLLYTGRYISPLASLRGSITYSLEGVFSSLGKGGALLEALILGKKKNAQYMTDLFREAGVSHLLALSGLHIGLVAAVIYGFLKICIPHILRDFILLLFLITYAWLVGRNPSFLRAVIMFAMAASIKTLGMKISTGKILVLAAIIQTLIWRDSLGAWSFRLSYGAMGGIVFFLSFWIILCRKIMPDFLALPVALSLAAQTAVLPMILIGFGWFQPAGIIAGLILTPLVIVYLAAGLGTLTLLIIFPSLAGLLSRPFSLMYDLMEFLALFFGRFPRWEFSSAGGKLLFFLSISVMIVLISLILRKELPLVRKNPQVEL